jgi:hypothetical protein
VNQLDCHRRPRIILREFGACMGAPGPHDFAVRVRAARLFDTSRVDRSPLHVRDDRDTPLCFEAGWRKQNMISEKTKVNYFCTEDWTAQINLKRQRKSAFTRTRSSRLSTWHARHGLALPVGRIGRELRKKGRRCHGGARP